MKMERARSLGFTSPHLHLPDDATQSDVVSAIRQMNDDPAVDAMLVQHPTPKQIDFEAALLEMDPDKDVDGLHTGEHGSPRPRHAGARALHTGRHRGAACAPRRPRRRSGGVHPRSRHHLGRPLALLLTQSGPTANAAVTVVHTGVQDWAEYTRRSAIVVAAVGVPGILRPEHISPGATVVGGGVRYEGKRLLPDVDEACNEVAGAITPRVGGVGPTTVAMLFRNLRRGG
jgi:methylenetetrahydrofolate dehydrogenase (NADP+)/methenyltetrahydrofolate cyclohydrolase